MSSFQGIWVPVVTPFHDGAIDYIGLRRLVSHLLEKHVAGIMVCTTTGQAAALSRQEQLSDRQPADRPVATGPIPAYRRTQALPFAVQPLRIQVTTCPRFPAPPSSS